MAVQCLLHHLVVELLIFTYSTTHHRAPDFPLFHGRYLDVSYLYQYTISIIQAELYWKKEKAKIQGPKLGPWIELSLLYY